MLERQHRGLKDSLRAALIQMGDTHQERWMDHLPFVLLGRRVAFQPDLGASPAEMTFGKSLVVPGQILSSPDTSGPEALQEVLKQVRLNTNTLPVQPSRHSPPEKPLADIPADVTHAYTRQHQKNGLQAHFEGPFRIDGRVSNSVVRLEVGTYKDGRKRFELRHLNDLKLTHPKSLAAPTERPKLGRPPLAPSSPSEARKTTDANSGESGRNRSNPTNRLIPEPTVAISPKINNNRLNNNDNSTRESHGTSKTNQGVSDPVTSSGPPPLPAFPSSRPIRSTRNPSPCYVDSISCAWSASQEEINDLNAAINRFSG